MFYIATVTREGKHLLAEFPDAPGCQTFAASEAKLRVAAKEALEGWLEAHLVSGQAPPRPRRRKGFIVPVDPALAVAIELRWARLDAGLSQADLAKRASVSQQQIAKLERPGENPSIATLTKVAAALGLCPDVRFLPVDTSQEAHLRLGLAQPDRNRSVRALLKEPAGSGGKSRDSGK